jgi:NAD(P)-dependent dehydrogenase (short-subunit alcohol dehydrogenase family)
MTSGVSRRIIPYWSLYATSKAALDMLVGTYAAECAHTSVRVNLFNPGPTRTGMRKEAFPGEDPESLPPPEAHAESLIQLALPSCTMNGEWVAGDGALSTIRST